MTWFIYMLCKHPEIQDKVAKEIKEAINFKNDVTNVEVFSNVVTEEALEKMHYLHAALTETLRLFPAVPVVIISYLWILNVVIYYIYDEILSTFLC